MAHVALIEDDPKIRNTLQIGLQLKGLRVTTFESAEKFLSQVPSIHSFDLLLVDLGLPGKSGEQLCVQIRKMDRDKPVLIITAKSEENDAVSAFEGGADDFVRKPFGLEELFVRIQRLLGRAISQRKISRFEGITLDRATRSALYQGEVLTLTQKEFLILETLIERAGEVISREKLLNSMDERLETSDRTLDSHVSHIRRKLKEIGASSVRISSVYGQGYRIERTE
jgi:DNA-binding response OmpR family regulator